MKVYFIGAGPGDLDLLTIKAKKVIEKADIIIYAGSLVNRAILKLAKRRAKVYDSSKMTLPEILNIIGQAGSKDKIIARIHSGDPSIYGAIQEQMDWCEKENIGYEVIPGISSFQAAAARLKQELTLPGVSQTIILTRISGRTGVPPPEDLERLARIKATLVIFLSIQEIERVVEKLKKGYSLDTPVIVLEKVSQKGERIFRGSLKDIAARVKKADITRQALIIVGDVLKKKYLLSRLYDKDFTHGFRPGKK
jgi:precorrin-4/cobalt-precorrin-4 C11-methyltransferase